MILEFHPKSSCLDELEDGKEFPDKLGFCVVRAEQGRQRQATSGLAQDCRLQSVHVNRQRSLVALHRFGSRNDVFLHQTAEGADEIPQLELANGLTRRVPNHVAKIIDVASQPQPLLVGSLGKKCGRLSELAIFKQLLDQFLPSIVWLAFRMLDVVVWKETVALDFHQGSNKHQKLPRFIQIHRVAQLGHFHVSPGYLTDGNFQDIDLSVAHEDDQKVQRPVVEVDVNGK